MLSLKECTVCGARKDLGEFPRDKRAHDGFASRCKTCNAKRLRDYFARNKDKLRDSQLRSLYGITLAQYEAMLLDQEGLCMICGVEMHPPHVDHSHATGEVRSLLCMRCNTVLGLCDEDGSILVQAAQYLEFFQ